MKQLNVQNVRGLAITLVATAEHAAGVTTIAFANYSAFDNVGNRKNKTTNASTESYSYDAIYRLISTATPKGTETYSYDAVGNRLTGPGPKNVNYQYNAGNQMRFFRRICGLLGRPEGLAAS